jgi:hypothetical protein
MQDAALVLTQPDVARAKVPQQELIGFRTVFGEVKAAVRVLAHDLYVQESS